MPRANHIQNSFTSGEISPEFSSRTDHEKYAGALREAINALVLPQGPITRRPGFRYVAAVKDVTKAYKACPFQFNTEQSYALLFGENNIRFFTDEAQLLDDVSGKGFTNGDFATDLSGWTDIDVGTGASTFSGGKMLLTGGAGTDYAIRTQQLPSGLGLGAYRVTLDVGVADVTYLVGTASGLSDIATGNLTAGVGKTFDFTLTTQVQPFITFRNTTASTAPTVDNVVLSIVTERPYEIYSPYDDSELVDVKYTQSADVLYLFHPNYEIKQLNRVGASRWTITDFDFIDGPFNPINTEVGQTITTSAAGDAGTAVNLTATGHAPWAATDVGRLVRHKRNGKWRSIKITTFTTSAAVAGTFQEDNPTGYTAGASSDWRLGTWSDTTGWPALGTFYQQRLMPANNELFPSKVWGSKSGLFTKFSPTDEDGVVQDDSGLDYLIASDQANVIHWLSSGRVLSIGTAEGEFILRAGSLSNPEALTPTNAIATRETTYGSDPDKRTARPGANVVLFVDVTRKKIREFVYDFNIEGFAAPELTLLARHLFKSGINDMCFAEDVLWVALDNGLLVSLTYLREQKVVACCQHHVGGSLTDFDWPVIETMCSIRSSDTSYQQVWAVVKRTINGTTKKYFEYMEALFDPTDENDKDDCFFVDSGLTYSGAATNVITGLDHLEGQTVAIWADGAPRANKVVAAGSITLGAVEATKCEKAQVGLPANWSITTLDPEWQSDAGSGRGKVKRAEKVSIKFINTLGCEIGPDEDHLDDITFREPEDPMDSSPPLFTGYKHVDFDGDLTDDIQIVLSSSQAGPITVAEILTDFSVNEA